MIILARQARDKHGENSQTDPFLQESAELLQAWLIQHGTEDELQQLYNQMLRRAAAEGDVSELRELLACGAAVDSSDEEGFTALHLAAEFGREQAVELLLEHGAELEACDDNGQTPLLAAVIDGAEAVVRTLLREGADVDRADDDGQVRTRSFVYFFILQMSMTKTGSGQT